MRVRTKFFVLAGVVLQCFLAANVTVSAQGAPEAPVEPQTLIRSLEGPDLFRAYCATCHGTNAKGGTATGPAAATNAPDLTSLTRRNGGQFPAARVRKIIMGDEILASHGTRRMPIWGPIFHQVESDQDRGNVRLENLVRYLESIQIVTLLPNPTGAELYQQLCVSCHGKDLKGGPPMPAPYRTPPDLTTLAKRHGGTFPSAYVEDVLRDGVVMPEHGPAEMPVWGMEFRVTDQLEQAQVRLRITKLTNYIGSRQAK